MQYKILALTDATPDGAMSYYRVGRPLGIMQGIEYDITQYNDSMTWDVLQRFNVLLVQRPQNELHCSIILRAKRLGLKIWADYDDMLWGVTSDSPAWEHYQDKKIIECIKQCMSEADVISVSTDKLQEELRKFIGRESVVVRNAIDKKSECKYKHHKRILWRGGETHKKDLLLEREELVEFAQSNEDIRFIFFGMQPWFVTDYMPNWVHAGFTDLMTYFGVLEKIDAGFAYIPLWDSPFNHCKSDIAALEAVNAGMLPVVSPGFSEFAPYTPLECNVTTATEGLSWYLGRSEDELRNLHKDLHDNLRLLKTENIKRWKILEGL